MAYINMPVPGDAYLTSLPDPAEKNLVQDAKGKAGAAKKGS